MSIKPNYIILAIDTSCDETSAAVTIDNRVLSNVIWSQIDIHRPWGGVVPDLARKEHQKNIGKVVDLAIKRADIANKRFRLNQSVNWQTIDAIAITQGPGLSIALEVGIEKAKQLALKYQKPLIAVNHMEGHLLSSTARNSNFQFSNSKFKHPISNLQFPILGLLISGGHTELIYVKKIGDYKQSLKLRYELIGQTLDDAAGEAFDKVAKMLNLGYPGGPIIEELAKKGDPTRFNFPVPMARSASLNFSFSGLKTACLYKLKEIPESQRNRQFYADFCASFQETLTKAIILKLKKATETYKPKAILLGGGVICNLYLRKKIRQLARKFNIPLFIPFSKNLMTDNAAMIGVAGFFKFQKDEFVENIENLDREPSLSF